jgi:hypothetical protein
VGRPGIGKGSAINPVCNLLEEAKVANIVSDRITIEYMLERMSQGWQTQVRSKAGGLVIGTDNTCLIKSTEFSVFAGASINTLPILADLWDSKEGDYIYGTRHKGEFRIKNPCVTLLGGSTQEWLIASIPSSAIGGGFTRRVNFVVANNREKLLPWPAMQPTTLSRDNLLHDLRQIATIGGEYKFDLDAMLSFEQCYKESDATEYDDEATTAYKTSLWAQVTKLAVCISASRGDSLIITKADFKKAYDAVKSVAANVPKVFRAVGESELIVASDKVLKFIEAKGFASKKELLKALWRDVTFEDLDKILATFKEGGILYEYSQGKSTMYALVEFKNNNKPKGKKP